MKNPSLFFLNSILAALILTQEHSSAADVAAWRIYCQLTNRLHEAMVPIVSDRTIVRSFWETNQIAKLALYHDEVKIFIDASHGQVLEAGNLAASSVRRFNPGDPTKSTHSKPTQNITAMEVRAKKIAGDFGWPIHQSLALSRNLALTNQFSTAGGNWSFRWHRKVNGFRIFHERVHVVTSDVGLALEFFKSTITTNAYDFPVGPLLTTNSLYEAVLKHVKLNHPTLLQRQTPDKQMPARLIVKEDDLPRELYVVEADYTQRWNYPTPAKGPKGKPKEPRLAWHINYAIRDGTPGRSEKLLHRDFGCFDAITGDALMHDW